MKTFVSKLEMAVTDMAVNGLTANQVTFGGEIADMSLQVVDGYLRSVPDPRGRAAHVDAIQLGQIGGIRNGMIAKVYQRAGAVFGGPHVVPGIVHVAERVEAHGEEIRRLASAKPDVRV